MSKDDRELIEGEALARRFHETYERLAPWFGYKTRADTKAFDPTTPNGRLMIAACSELAATRLEALQAQPVGERDREYWARVLHDAWPHTVISQALSEVTGLPIGTVLSWDAVKEAGADCSGLYRFADAVVAALTASPPVVEREAIANALHMEARRLSRAVDGSDDCPETYDQDALNWVRNRRYQLADAILALTPVEGVGESFQARVAGWMQQCFGPVIAADKLERNDRFIEESLELVQSLGYSQDRAHALVDYVFGRPIGEPSQEVGGVMVTLAALCEPSSIDLTEAAETELARILQPAIVAKIRAKQAAKPTGSALPISTPVAQGDEVRDALRTLRYVVPYLDWTIGSESPGYHPTMPSAVAEFKTALATLTNGARDAG